MKNEEQFVVVRFPLSDEQVDKFCDGAEREMVVSRDDRKVAEAGIRNVAAPIPPCADVETVGWARDYVFAALKNPGCCAVSIHNEFEGGVPLVRRTDMEAQVALAYEKGWAAGKRDACNQQARVAAEKDADIKRLKMALSDIWCTLLQATESEAPTDNLVSSALKVLRWSDAAINGRPVE